MRRLALTALAAAGLAACAAPQAPAPAPGPARAAVIGEVSYRERILLPPTTTLKVALEDVSLADAPAKVLAEQTQVIGPKAPPYPYRLAYDPAWVEAGHTYAVRAELREPDGTLRFVTATRHAVELGGVGETRVDVMLEAAAP